MSRRVFVTGAAGFIGGATVRILQERGDQVVAVVRDPSKTSDLDAIGTQVIAGDLGSETAIRATMSGCDAVIHLAGSYRVGIPASERPAMYEANVALTERVLDAAISLGIPRIVTASTVNVFGNTRGRIVDEKYRRDPADGFLSYYDETKYRAHVAAKARISAGAPIVIVMPGATYGPAIIRRSADSSRPSTTAGRDTPPSASSGSRRRTSTISRAGSSRRSTAVVRARATSWPARTCAFATRSGSSPRRPAVARRASASRPACCACLPGSHRVADGLLGQPPNVAEIVSAAAGVTYWASSAKAQADLGYRTRDLERGARDAYGRP